MTMNSKKIVKLQVESTTNPVKGSIELSSSGIEYGFYINKEYLNQKLQNYFDLTHLQGLIDDLMDIKDTIILLTSTEPISAPDVVNLTITKGSVTSTTKINNASIDSGNSLSILVSSTVIPIPNVGSTLSIDSSIVANYVVGTDIIGVDVTNNKYLAVYEVNSTNKVVRFSCKILDATTIK